MFCRVCKSKNLINFVDLGSSPPSNGLIEESVLKTKDKYYPLNTKVCKDCFTVQVEDFLEADEMFSSEYTYFSSFSKTWLNHAERFSRKTIKELKLSNDSLVIEIASNDGYLLQFYQEKKIPCLGIEPTLSTAKAAEEKGIKVIKEFFNKKLAKNLLKKFQKPDLIIANNVIAHVPNPVDFLEGVKLLMNENTICSIEFHSLKELISFMAIDTIYHEHYSYFSLTSFKNLVSQVGLRIVNVEKLSTHGGSLRVYLKKENSEFKGSNLVEKILKEEKDFGISNIDTYVKFSKKIENIKKNTIDFFDKLYKNNIKVAGYGAAAKASTILNYAKIDSDFLPFIADANPNKVGKYIPGCRIPIKSIEEILKFNPDVIIIFPWNLEKEIKEDLEKKMNKKIDFFRLIPDVTKI